MLAACGSTGTTGSINNGGGGTGGGGTGGGGTGGGGTGGGGTGGGSGGSGIQLRGLATKFNKAAMQQVPGMGTLYEMPTGDYTSDDTPVTRTNSAITASLKLEGPQATGGKATISTGGKFADGKNVPGTNGAWGQTIPTADGDTETLYLRTGEVSPGDKIRVVSRDEDGDDKDDFFAVDQHSGGTDTRLAQETIGIYYGGDFAPASALTGKTTATYSRKAGVYDAGVVRITTGSGMAQSNPTIYKGDVSLTADFTAAKVNGRIDNIDRIAGTGATNFDVVLEDAKIKGVHYDDGKVRLVQAGTNTNTATIDNSAFIGSFMGKDAERTAGVFQATGQIGGKQAFVSGRFAADEVKK
jgi:hypothetical protein